MEQQCSELSEFEACAPDCTMLLGGKRSLVFAPKHWKLNSHQQAAIVGHSCAFRPLRHSRIDLMKTSIKFHASTCSYCMQNGIRMNTVYNMYRYFPCSIRCWGVPHVFHAQRIQTVLWSVPDTGDVDEANVCKASSEEDAVWCDWLQPEINRAWPCDGNMLPSYMKYSRIMQDLASNISSNIGIALSRLLMSHQSLVENWSGPPQDVGLAKLAVFFTTRRADYRSAMRSDGVHALLAGRENRTASVLLHHQRRLTAHCRRPT